MPDSVGVEVGKRADRLLLTASPLDDIGNVQKGVGVMAVGRCLTEENIQARLSEIASTLGDNVLGHRSTAVAVS